MSESNAELSSLATVLDELTRRVTRNAEAAAAAHDEEVASELFAIERALGGASRRLSRLSVSQDRKARRWDPRPTTRDSRPTTTSATRHPQFEAK